MDPNTFITSIDFATRDGNVKSEMAGIRLNYSDGSTYLFENNVPQTHGNRETFEIDRENKISAVQANVDYTIPLGMAFLDSQDNKLYEYKHDPYSYDIEKYDIGQNEEIIGIYGHGKTQRWFNSLGFIVKVNPN